jgi:two-component system sensor histidine kinase PilS (NtrC family)
MEQELRRSERLAAVGELAAKMAHEIRNPLAAISGSVQVLRADMRDDEVDDQRDRLMSIVVREAHRLGNLIQDFLHYARPRPLSLQAIAVDTLLDDVVKLFESSLPENVRLVVDPLPPLVARGDPDQLKQVTWNLLVNAAQAMPEGGELHVWLEAAPRDSAQARAGSRRNGRRGQARREPVAPRWVEICVSDSGVGIPSEVQDQIFEPFFTTKKNGSGLGLSIVHRIIESHGGMLQVQSQPGEGSTFRASIPELETESSSETRS